MFVLSVETIYNNHIDFGAVGSSSGDTITASQLYMKHGSIFGHFLLSFPIFEHLASNIHPTFMWIADGLNQSADKIFFCYMISEHLNYISKILTLYRKIQLSSLFSKIKWGHHMMSETVHHHLGMEILLKSDLYCSDHLHFGVKVKVSYLATTCIRFWPTPNIDFWILSSP